MKLGFCCASAVLAMIVAPVAVASPTLGQVNDFQTGQVSGWTNGGGAADPVLVANAGPGGTGDTFLRASATGSGSAGSRLIIFNTNQRWTGNFTTSNVTAVTMDLKNLGTTPLSMRIAIDGNSTWFATTTAFALPADNAWHSARFELGTNMTRIEGSQSLAQVLAQVSEFRILHSSSPNYKGDPIASSFGVDNIRAVPEPAGLLALGLLPLLARRRRAS